ncbi:MAG: exostosin family protein [Bacteroidetes bacterium]|nr:exostosin family protein [Bacteroidota bacterium]
MQFSVYTNKEWLPKNFRHVPMLFPFWGQIDEPKNSPDEGRFDELTQQGNKFYKLAERIDDADCILLPFDYVFDVALQSVYKEIQALAIAFNKKVIVFNTTDNDAVIEFENAVILRTSGNKSTSLKNIHATLGWSKDFIHYSNQQLNLRKKQNKPVIGYCGYIDYVSEKDLLKQKGITSFLKQKLFNTSATDKGTMLRGKAVRQLQNVNNITANFIIRNGFWAEGMENKNEVRLQYADNIINSDYTLSIRGNGNFSYRLYEVMSCGRIPVFVNTDCILPYENFINWKDYVVWIEENEMNNLSEKIFQFHNNISESKFEQQQANNRSLYQEWLSPLGFHKNLYRYFLN